MSYYDELLNKVKELIDKGDYNKASSLIDKELSMPYIPSDFEPKLRELLSLIPIEIDQKSLSDDQIIEYLISDEMKQLRAVEELNKKNLREYLDICGNYLCSEGFINAKALLVDSLIKQDINEEINMLNNGLEYSFIPKYILSPENSLGFLEGLKLLSDKYMKEPSKLELAKQLLYKECLLALPVNYEEDDGPYLADKVYEYIENAFNAA